jgi:hypothetical protein
MNAEELTAQGYCRISNKYGIVARVDRADWWEALEDHFRRNMPIRTEAEVGRWADYYRRGISQDRLEVGPEIARNVPQSNHNPTGYVSKS